MPVSAHAVRADGRVASGSTDHTIRLWKPANGACEATLEGHTSEIPALAMRADGRRSSLRPFPGMVLGPHVLLPQWLRGNGRSGIESRRLRLCRSKGSSGSVMPVA
ncbi:WD40 repeat domain-containing protein [Paraburkholderia sp. EG287B]|uniref:WD40 repeat domain-containing protein n=1 Tax=Paraburkholderia sp. EG287B TaxID=3237010 RepID=UPI0034D20AB1